jgi:PadR family transcriptional regulator, regulatory protein PadR
MALLPKKALTFFICSDPIYVDILGMEENKKSDLLQGTLDLLILKTLAAGALHGYAIAQRILVTSRETLDVQQGSLYPALHRLERKQLVEAEWRESDNGRMAKFYSLTKAGRKQLSTELDRWQLYSKAIGWVLEA